MSPQPAVVAVRLLLGGLGGFAEADIGEPDRLADGGLEACVAADDLDEDWLPDDDEAALVPGHAYDNEDRCTYPDTFNYGEDPIPDVEDYCLRRQAAWNNGDADDEDWANPGHQY